MILNTIDNTIDAIDPTTPTSLASVTVLTIDKTVEADGTVSDLKFTVEITTADGRTVPGNQACGRFHDRGWQWVTGSSPAELAADPSLLKLAIARLAQALFDSHFVTTVGGVGSVGLPTTSATIDSIDPATIMPGATLSGDEITTLLSAQDLVVGVTPNPAPVVK
jgi:hypothetical protein